MTRIRALLTALLCLLPLGNVLAQPPPPAFEGYRFFAFLDVSTNVEEPLPTVIRREMPELPQAWYEVEKYISTYYPNAFTAPRSRILKPGASIRLPLYRKPTELVYTAPPPPAPEPVPVAKKLESIIGALIQSDGPVQAESSLGLRRALLAIDNVRRGDTISTDDRSAASVRLLDGTTILLRAGSSVLLKEFRFAKGDTNTGVLKLKLLKGAMRTISGMIPKDASSTYALETPKATMKVRGTDYAVRLCEEADRCMIDGEIAPTGLYAGVLEGGIDLGNRSGSKPANAGDIVRVDTADAAPKDAPEAAALVFTAAELPLLPIKLKPCDHPIGKAMANLCSIPRS